MKWEGISVVKKRSRLIFVYLYSGNQMCFILTFIRVCFYISTNVILKDIFMCRVLFSKYLLIFLSICRNKIYTV